jgi:4-amino-4-deoxy-L-arabinose transferase-like glycosyltransferase
VAAIVLLLVGVWWLRSPLHMLPLQRDEGAYALIATRWLRGAVFYRDLFDHKPPFVYLVYALAPRFAAAPVVAVRELATAYLMLVGVASTLLAWRLYGRSAALSGLLLTLVYSSSPAFEGLTFNSEAIMALPALIACLLVIIGVQSGKRWLLCCSGIAVGIVILSKLVGVIMAVPLALAPLLTAWPWRKRLSILALVLSAAALPLLICTALLWQHDALPDTYTALIGYNRIYAAESIALGWDPIWLWRIWAPMLPLFLPALGGLLLTWRVRDRHTDARRIAALWGIALLASALLSLRDYPHYYLAAVPFGGMWAGAGIAQIGRIARGTRRVWLAPIQIAALIALIVQPVAAVRDLGRQIPHVQSGMLYANDGWMFFGVADTVAAYVRQHVRRQQPIFVWAAEPEIYYLSGRGGARRGV